MSSLTSYPLEYSCILGTPSNYKEIHDGSERCHKYCWALKAVCKLILHVKNKCLKHTNTYVKKKIHAAAAKSLQSCPTLCDPTDGSPPGSPIPGILQARTLEWVAISFSNAWKWKVKVKPLSRVRRFATPWTAAYQAPPPVGFSRQEYWSGVPLPSPRKSSTTF